MGTNWDAYAGPLSTHHEVSNHTFRGTGITAHLENGGTLEKARQMAAHASTRATQLYDRREDRVTLDEVVKINIPGVALRYERTLPAAS
jgi:hypothetical protein